MVRTVTEAQNFSTGGLVRGRSLVRTATTFQSGARGALADKLDELEQLRDEMRQRDPADAVIPPGCRRSCAACCGEFTSFEGGQCTSQRNDHFLCNVCFGGYLLTACSRGGVFEQVRSSDCNFRLILLADLGLLCAGSDQL